MTNIVITGHTSFCNRGNEALVRSTIDLMERELPQSHYSIFSLTPTRDHKSYGAANRRVNFLPLRYNPRFFLRKGRLWFTLAKKYGINFRPFLRLDETSFKAIRECDILLISGGDLLSGYGLNAIQTHTFLAWAAIGMGKPVVIFAHSFNPFDSTQELLFAQKVLNQMSLITVRESISEAYLKKVGIQAPIHLSADPAFWLPAAENQQVDTILNAEGVPPGIPLFGVSASALMTWGIEGNFEKYTSFLAEMTDHIIEKYQMAVIFIPHVIGPSQLGGDDRLAAMSIIKKTNNPDKAYSIRGEYNAMELKGIIGRCQAFIGSRMHATIAATSMLVPTIGLAYSIKAHGVLGELVDSRPIVFNMKDLRPSDLSTAIEDLLQNRNQFTAELTVNLPGVREKALVTSRLSAALVAKTIN